MNLLLRLAISAAHVSLLAGTSAFLATAAPVHAGSNPLEPYAGKFRGSGTVRRAPDEPAESVRCRITATLSEDGSTLQQKGTCAVPGSKAKIDSRIKHNPANGRLTGSWTDVANGSRASVAGSVRSGTVRLTIVGKDEKTGENRTVWMILKPTSSGYRMTSTSPDNRTGKKFQSGEIRFTK